ncbi:hypothetical protein YN120080_35 [Staphylococcus phage vB_SauM_JDYN]|nr:hypothetical protein YN120080_35 [Staphylococcus phage vB_SauM_JDYN]
MVKIKTKKQLNLPQLIEYVWENGITNKEYICDGFEIKSVVFNLLGWAEFSDEFSYNPDDTFTVEVEEELTEDTEIPKMLVIGRFDGYEEVYNQKLSSFNQHLLSAYLIQDDGHMELIYDEVKGLVE